MTRHPVPLRLQLVTLSLTRTATDTGYRMVFPFLPAIARGLSVDLTTVALIISLRQSMGVFVPLLGTWSDRRGRKPSMLLGLALYVTAFLSIALVPKLLTFAVAVGVAAIAKAILDPAVFAYLGDRVKPSRQSMAVAITEFSWSGSFLVGVPIVGWLIARFGWSAPFPFLAALMILGGGALHYSITPDPPSTKPALSFSASIRGVLRRPSVPALLAVGLLTSAGNGVVTIVYGAWIESQFGLEVVALGIFSIVIGLAEFSGEGLVAGFVDRLDKRLAIGMGSALNLIAALALPLLGKTLVGAAIALFIFYMSFEFGLVSASPLLLELVPEARATTMASKTAVQRTGFALGSFLGPLFFMRGIQANGIVSASLTFLAVLTLWLFVPHSEKLADGSSHIR